MRFEIKSRAQVPASARSRVRLACLATLTSCAALAFLLGATACGSSSSSNASRTSRLNTFGRAPLGFASALTSSEVPAGEILFPNSGLQELLHITMNPFAIKRRLALPNGWESAKFIPGPNLAYVLLVNGQNSLLLSSTKGVQAPQEDLLGDPRGVLLHAPTNQLALFDSLGGLALRRLTGEGVVQKSLLAGPRILGSAVVSAAFLTGGTLVLALEDGVVKTVDVRACLDSGTFAATTVPLAAKFSPVWLEAVPGSASLLLGVDKEKVATLDVVTKKVETKVSLESRPWFASSEAMPHVIVAPTASGADASLTVGSKGAVTESKFPFDNSIGRILASNLDTSKDDWWIFVGDGNSSDPTQAFRYRYSDGLARVRTDVARSNSESTFFTREALVRQSRGSRLGYLEKRPYTALQPSEFLKNFNLEAVLGKN